MFEINIKDIRINICGLIGMGGGYGQSAVKVIKEKMPFKLVKQLTTLLLFLETTQIF